MAYPGDYLTDYLHCDGVTDFSYTDSSGSVTAGVKVQLEEMTYKDALFTDGAGLGPADVVLVAWASTLPAAAPQRGAVLSDASGNRYEIKGMNAVLIRGVVVKYRCYVVRLP